VTCKEAIVTSKAWSWLVLASVGLSGNAWANPLDVFGLGSRGAAMGSARTAAADDSSAVYYNTAGLARARPGMTVGLVMAYDDVHVHLKTRPAGYDLPDLGASGAAIGSKYRLRQRGDTTDIPNTYGLNLGLVGSLGLDKLRVGVTAFLPMNHIGSQDSHFADEREQYFGNKLPFELLGQRSQHMVLMAGVAYQLTPWLALGSGLAFLPQASTQAQVFLPDATHQEQLQMIVHNDQVGRFAQHAGVMLTPSEVWQFGLSWRGENYFELLLDNEIQIKGFQGSTTFPVHQKQDIVASFHPHELTAGASWHPGTLQLTADVSRMLWSRYRNGQGEFAGFQDTTSVRGGLAWQSSAGRVLMAGVRWEPTPVPEQTWRTSYVDNDRVVASLGAAHDVKLFDKPVHLGWHAQWQHLLARDTNKAVLKAYAACAPGVTSLCDELADDAKDAYGQPVPQAKGLQSGSPGFPGFQSWGDIVAIGVDAAWDF
jgi:long-chain fatty acid transport protein